MKTSVKHLSIANEVDVASARIAGAVLAHESGFDVIERYYVVTSIAELASVILRDSGTGSIDLQVLCDGQRDMSLRIVAQRRGPGSGGIPSRIQDSFTAERGVRNRLPQIRRLMSELHLASGLSAGSVAQTMKRLNEHGPERAKLWKNWQPRPATAARAGASAA